MAFSIESRVPFLDHRLVEFCINLPDELKIYNGWTKYVLRKSSEKYLPKEIIWQKEKIGFVTPEKLWFDSLFIELQTLIRDHEIPEIIDKDKLSELIKQRNSNKMDLAELWKTIMFIKWFNVFKLKCF